MCAEKDILKLVNVIIANTKGDGEKSSEDFWVKAERLLYCALIGYLSGTRRSRRTELHHASDLLNACRSQRGRRDL